MGIICTVTNAAAFGLFLAGALSDGLGGMGAIGGIICIVGFIFHIVQMSLLSAWWASKYCGAKVKDMRDAELSYALPAYVLIAVIFIVVAIMSFVCGEGL